MGVTQLAALAVVARQAAEGTLTFTTIALLAADAEPVLGMLPLRNVLPSASWYGYVLGGAC